MKKIAFLLIALFAISVNLYSQNKIKGENKMNVLVAYFSATGTTETVAKQIAKATNGTLHKIEPKDVYTNNDLNWQNNNSRANIESKDRSTRPEVKDVSLENVPMFALLANGVYKYKRLAAIGPFGIASFHELKVPKRVYVDDIDNLTQNDKKRIFDTIREDIDKVIAKKSGQDQINYRKEEDEATVDIVDNTYVRTFSDGSKLKLGLRSFVRQRELGVLYENNTVNWKDSVDIALGVNDPEFKNEMIAMPTEGELPAGLGWDKTTVTEDVPNGMIRGIPDIDWSKVEGVPGKKQVTFTFNIALRKEDGTINTRPETKKTITITVKQDEDIVPVGVEDFPTTPFVVLSMTSLGAITIIFLRRRTQQE